MQYLYRTARRVARGPTHGKENSARGGRRKVESRDEEEEERERVETRSV